MASKISVLLAILAAYAVSYRHTAQPTARIEAIHDRKTQPGSHTLSAEVGARAQGKVVSAAPKKTDETPQVGTRELVMSMSHPQSRVSSPPEVSEAVTQADSQAFVLGRPQPALEYDEDLADEDLDDANLFTCEGANRDGRRSWFLLSGKVSADRDNTERFVKWADDVLGRKALGHASDFRTGQASLVFGYKQQVSVRVVGYSSGATAHLMVRRLEQCPSPCSEDVYIEDTPAVRAAGVENGQQVILSTA